MKNQILKTIAIALLCFNVNAQTKNVEIKFSSEDLELTGGRTEQIDGSGNYGYFIQDKIEKGIIIKKFDSNLGYVDSIFWPNSNLETEQKEVKIASLFLRNNILFFKSTYNKQKQIHEFQCQSINKKTLKTEGKPIITESYSHVKPNSGWGFLPVVSSDLSKFAVFHPDEGDKKENKDSLFISVYDSALNLLWRKKIEITTPWDLTDLSSYTIDNSGNAYFTTTVYFEKYKFVIDKKPNYQYNLFCISNKGEKNNSFTFESKEKFLNNLIFKTNDNKEIFVAGVYNYDWIYSNNSRAATSHYRTADGYFYSRIDLTTMKMSEIFYKDFDHNFIIEGIKSRDLKDKKELGKGQSGIDLLTFRQIYFLENGNVLLIGERELSMWYSSGNSASTYGHKRDDIILICINASNQEVWKKKIRKMQVGEGIDPFISYLPINLGNKVLILFNDRKENLNLSKELPLERYRSNGFGAAKDKNVINRLFTVSLDGNLTEESFQPDNADLNVIAIEWSKQVNGNQVFMLQSGKKNLAVITFKDASSKPDLINGY